MSCNDQDVRLDTRGQRLFDLHNKMNFRRIEILLLFSLLIYTLFFIDAKIFFDSCKEKVISEYVIEKIVSYTKLTYFFDKEAVEDNNCDNTDHSRIENNGKIDNIELHRSIKDLPRLIKDELHHQKFIKTIFQILIVFFLVVIYFQYFLLFDYKETTLRERKKEVFFLLSLSVWYLLVMHDEYQPAIFFMALAAIFVAAEHYGELEKSEHHANNISNRLDKAALNIEKIISADGLRKWKNILYEGWYGSTNRIEGIIKIFDIDDHWWVPNDSVSKNQRWKNYLFPHLKGENNREKTLYQSLIHCNPRRPLTEPLQMPEVLFVADVPMPGSERWRKTWENEDDKDESSKSKSKANQFSTFLGFTWQLVVFSLVRKKRKSLYRRNIRLLHIAETQENPENPHSENVDEVPFLRIVVSAAPNWMHVYDVPQKREPSPQEEGDHLLEVIVGSDAKNINQPDHDQTYARILTNRVDKNSEQRRRLVNWARQDIRWHAARGGEAEEYMMSLIRYGLLDKDLHNEQQLNIDLVERLFIKDFDFDAWYRLMRKSEVLSEYDNEDTVRKICASVFYDFICIRIKECDPFHIEGIDPSLKDFDYESI